MENEGTDFSENKFLLEVNEKNARALKLYKKIGFEKISIRKNYYGKDENAVIMVKCINFEYINKSKGEKWDKRVFR